MKRRLSLQYVMDVLSRDEMKMIMAGSSTSGGGGKKSCTSCYVNGTPYFCQYDSINNSDTCTCSAGQHDGTGCKVKTN